MGRRFPTLLAALLTLLLPLEVSVSGTTLTVKMQGSAGATGTGAADYVCQA